MTAAATLAGFSAVLALVFGGAAFAGSRVDVRAAKPVAKAMGEMTAHGAAAAQAVRGLAVSDGGLTLELERTSAPRGRRFELAFRIADRGGRTVRDFDVEHTKRMHFIVVRRDLTSFQHLHPVERADGTWSVPVELRDAGTYRAFADFSVDGKPRTLAADVAVDGELTSRPVPPPASSVDVDGLRVSLTEGAAHAGQESELGFEVTRAGKPVAIEDYLGAKGHLVALRQGDLAFLHVHPDERSLRFMATFPTAGTYRLFLQFKTNGRVHTAAFTQEVSR